MMSLKCENDQKHKAGKWLRWNKNSSHQNSVSFPSFVESKTYTNKQTNGKQNQAGRYREQTGGCQREVSRRMGNMAEGQWET